MKNMYSVVCRKLQIYTIIFSKAINIKVLKIVAGKEISNIFLEAALSLVLYLLALLRPVSSESAYFGKVQIECLSVATITLFCGLT